MHKIRVIWRMMASCLCILVSSHIIEMSADCRHSADIMQT
jgi:hypothetical protein